MGERVHLWISQCVFKMFQSELRIKTGDLQHKLTGPFKFLFNSVALRYRFYQNQFEY